MQRARICSVCKYLQQFRHTYIHTYVLFSISYVYKTNIQAVAVTLQNQLSSRLPLTTWFGASKRNTTKDVIFWVKREGKERDSCQWTYGTLYMYATYSIYISQTLEYECGVGVCEVQTCLQCSSARSAFVAVGANRSASALKHNGWWAVGAERGRERELIGVLCTESFASSEDTF